MSVSTMQEIKKKRILFLVMSTVALLFLGLIYAFSMFAGSLVSFFGLEKSAVRLTFNIMMITFCFGGTIGAIVEKKIGVRGTLILSAILFFIGFAGTGAFGNGNIAVLYIFYGVIGGMGVGMGYNIIVATTNVWFPDKVGFSSGVLMMGFALGSLVLGNISVALFPTLGLSMTLIGIGVITGVLVFLLSGILHRPPSDIASLLAPEKIGAAGYDPADDDSILKSPTFYVYWIWAIIVIAIGLATIGNAASDAQVVGIAPAAAIFLVGLVSSFNGLARVIVGIIYDKTDVKKTMFFNGLVAIVATVCISIAFVTHVNALYIIGALLCGFCYGGVPVVASAFARQRFGAKNYPVNLSIANFAIMLGSIVNIIIMALAGAENRQAVFVVLMVLAVVAVISVLPFSRLWNRDLKVLAQRRKDHSA